MNQITVAGAGAFGTALAIALAREGNKTQLWARNAAAASDMQTSRINHKYLPEIRFPDTLKAINEAAEFALSDIILLAVPTQNLRGFLQSHAHQLGDKTCVLCCKGIEKG